MCGGCGKPIRPQAVRLQAIEPDGRASFYHQALAESVRDRLRPCGPLILERLGRRPPEKARPEPPWREVAVEQAVPAQVPTTPAMPVADAIVDYYALVEAYQKALVEWALRVTGQNTARAARRLTIKRTTLAAIIRRSGWETKRLLVKCGTSRMAAASGDSASRSG
jgi:DNA-binding NtrC family response regulator